MKTALLIIDHGSKRKEANDMIFDVVAMLQKTKPQLIIEGCHMELAAPTIEDGVRKCVEKGATKIIAQPYMLSPGRHATKDIPNLLNDAIKLFPDVTLTISSHFGVAPKICELILEKNNLD